MKMYLQFDAGSAPYILTKPFHASQTILKEDEKGIIISIEVVLNFELEREILGFGETIKVLGPRLLVKRIQSRLQKATNLYEDKEIKKEKIEEDTTNSLAQNDQPSPP
jgi:predicted DNA-binding transcriptional regulator YafY